MIMHNEGKYDFSAFGQAIKEARESRGWTRERLAQEVALAPRYIMSLENKGQHLSFQVFYEFVTLFHISVDQFLFPDTGAEKTTRRQLESQIDELDEADFIIMAATAKGIQEAKGTGE